MISPSDHEEADTRSMLHAAHMKQQGFNSIVLKTNKTDVLILSIYTQANLGFNIRDYAVVRENDLENVE